MATYESAQSIPRPITYQQVGVVTPLYYLRGSSHATGHEANQLLCLASDITRHLLQSTTSLTEMAQIRDDMACAEVGFIHPPLKIIGYAKVIYRHVGKLNPRRIPSDECSAI